MTDRYDDLWHEPTAKRFVRHAIEEMAPKMASSAFVMIAVPDEGAGEVKFWVEIGAAIMMDKPLIGLVFGDRPIPPKLELVADEIIRCPEGAGPEATEKIGEAVKRVIERKRRG